MIAASLIDENRLSYQLNTLAKHYAGESKDEKILIEAAKEYGLDPKADMCGDYLQCLWASMQNKMQSLHLNFGKD